MIRQSFNDGWNFKKGEGGLMDALRGGGMDYVPVTLPHDAMIHETPVREALSGAQTGFYPGGEYAYMKQFDVPADWEGRKILIEFEGAYMIAKVYINNCHAATNLYGYSGFYVEADALLRCGATNEIKAVVNNPTPNSRWYSGSGIFRKVNLLVGDKVYIEADGVRAETKLATDEEAILEIETRLANLTRSRQGITLRTVLSYEGEAVKTDEVHLGLFSEDHEVVRQNLRIANPKLWDIDTPNLYSLRVEILQDGNVLDAAEETIGLRTLTLDAEVGMRINGKVFKQKGTCIHHDNGVIGAATFAAAEERRARQIKAAGFNAIRSAHHPMSPEMLAACDKVGLVVMDELSDMWYLQKNPNDFSTYFDVCWEQEIERMVAKDFNHPCVILYSTGNEILDLGYENGGKINRRLCRKFHELDHTRFTTTAVNGLMNAIGSGNMGQIMGDIMKKLGIQAPSAQQGDSGIGGMNMMMSLVDSDDFATHPLVSKALEEAGQAADVCGYNYLTSRHGELEKRLHPNKPVLGTETYPADIVRLWSIVEKYPHVLGDYTWTGYDYLGEAGCGIFYYDGTVNFSSHFPDRIAYIGDIDIIGSRRPISYLREIVFGARTEPYIAVTRVTRYGKTHSKTSWMYKDNVACWTWPGEEGHLTEVEVYSPDDEVELFINGVSQGRKPAGPEHAFTAVYEITYVPGEIRAVSYADGQEKGHCVLKTAGEKTVLQAVADKAELCADGQDLAFITVSLTDAEGVLKMTEKREITVSVEGEGVLQGFGSANPQPLTGYDETTWETYDGKVMAVIRATENKGPIRVRFTSEGLEDAVVELRTII